MTLQSSWEAFKVIITVLVFAAFLYAFTVFFLLLPSAGPLGIR